VGASVGASVVGASVGALVVGASVVGASVVGVSVGASVVGTSMGVSVTGGNAEANGAKPEPTGAVVGSIVGNVVGASDGLPEGPLVGDDDVVLVGPWEGETEELLDCCSVLQSPFSPSTHGSPLKEHRSMALRSQPLSSQIKHSPVTAMPTSSGANEESRSAVSVSS